MRKGTIYQCKLNNIYLNLTKNQYFITKLLVRMKKDCGSRAVWGWEASGVQCEEGMIHEAALD